MAKSWDKHIIGKLARVEAERDKFRTALQVIASMGAWNGRGLEFGMRDVAEAALKETE